MPWWLVSFRATRCGSSLQFDQSNLWVVRAGIRRDGKIWDGARLPRSVAEDFAAKGDRSVRGAFSLGELQEAIRLAAAQPVDSDAGARVPIPRRRF